MARHTATTIRVSPPAARIKEPAAFCSHSVRAPCTDDSALTSALTSHIYAVNGDIAGLGYGEVSSVFGGVLATTSYRAAKLVDIAAGGDIVNLKGLIVQNDPSDISMIAAGGNIVYAGIARSTGGSLFTGLQIAGPGTLEVTAGKNIYQGSIASIESIGPLVIGDNRPGASVVMQAGVGAGTPGEGQVDWPDFAKLYLDPANLAGTGPLADQPGKVAKTYNSELVGWLKTRFGYIGSADDALAYFLALPPEQQRAFLRIVYYAELTAGGREFNDKNGPRTGSYLRGREAIAALFPAAAGSYDGDITMFSAKSGNSVVTSASVHTDFGGDIQFLAPGGQGGCRQRGTGAWRRRRSDYAGRWRHPDLLAEEHSAWTLAHHDDVRRRYPRMVRHGRYQRRPRLKDDGDLHPAAHCL